MKTVKIQILLPFIFLALSSFAPVENPDAILGTWLVGKKNAKVKIEKRDGKYYGKIVWLKEPNNEDGSPKKDKNNPDKGQRNNPIMGLQLLRNFEYEEKNTWEDGRIYDPESGNDYSCIITMKDPNTLDVRGYIGFSFIGRSDTWTRVE